MSTKDRYEFIVEYRHKPGGRTLSRKTKFYARSYEEAVSLVKKYTKHLVSYSLNTFNPEEVEVVVEGQVQCFICTNPRLEFSRFCKEHYLKINGTEDILLVHDL